MPGNVVDEELPDDEDEDVMSPEESEIPLAPVTYLV